MSGPRKPPEVSVVAAPNAALTADQARVVQLYSSMDDKTQKAVMTLLAGIAEGCPRHMAPALRLVRGGTA